MSNKSEFKFKLVEAPGREPWNLLTPEERDELNLALGALLKRGEDVSSDEFVDAFTKAGFPCHRLDNMFFVKTPKTDASYLLIFKKETR